MPETIPTTPAAHVTGLIRPSRRMLSMFEVYLRWYIGRHFRALRVAHSERFPMHARPLILYLNHASWWDPLTCIVLSRYWLPHADHYAPMEAASLREYSFMSKLGLFPVESGTRRGAAQFLRAADEILAMQDSVLWITPEGHFSDVRTRPIVFRPGLAALISRLPECTVVPLAIEYTFWDERLPEILACCGEPISVVDGRTRSVSQWEDLLTGALTATQDELAALGAQRADSNFDTVISGRAGVNGIYDAWLRAHRPKAHSEREGSRRA